MPRAKSPRTPKTTTKPAADNNILHMPETGNGSPHNGSREWFFRVQRSNLPFAFAPTNSTQNADISKASKKKIGLRLSAKCWRAVLTAHNRIADVSCGEH